MVYSFFDPDFLTEKENTILLLVGFFSANVIHVNMCIYSENTF